MGINVTQEWEMSARLNSDKQTIHALLTSLNSIYHNPYIGDDYFARIQSKNGNNLYRIQFDTHDKQLRLYESPDNGLTWPHSEIYIKGSNLGAAWSNDLNQLFQSQDDKTVKFAYFHNNSANAPSSGLSGFVLSSRQADVYGTQLALTNGTLRYRGLNGTPSWSSWKAIE